MLMKKYTIRSDSKIDSLINSLINGEYDKDSAEARILGNSDTLGYYFTDLQEYITPNNILLVRKYEILPDGLYVLLKGQISFKQFTSSYQNQREQNRSKNFNRNSSGMNYISHPLSVFESSMKNSTALEDSYLLRIFQYQKVDTQFEQKFLQRKNLCDNYYVSHYHEFLRSSHDSMQLITADFKLHSNFVYKSYTFRENLYLKDISIIKQGRVKYNSTGNTVELERYALLLPEINYEVTTSSLQLLIVYGNEPLNIKFDSESQVSKETKMCWFPTVNKIGMKNNTERSENLKHALNAKYQNVYNKKQKLKRQKQMARLSKESQSFSIISTFLCKKSLDFAKKQIDLNKTKLAYEKPSKNPVVLFNFNGEKTSPQIFRNAEKSFVLGQSKTGNSSKEKEKSLQATDRNQKQSILRKLKLPLAEYQKMFKKHALARTCSNLFQEDKSRSLVTLTLAKHSSDKKQNMRSQEQTFVRYRDS